MLVLMPDTDTYAPRPLGYLKAPVAAHCTATPAPALITPVLSLCHTGACAVLVPQWRMGATNRKHKKYKIGLGPFYHMHAKRACQCLAVKQFWLRAPSQVFCAHLYNHAHRFRLEKLFGLVSGPNATQASMHSAWHMAPCTHTHALVRRACYQWLRWGSQPGS
jgi:hypothetical protein